MLQRRDGPLHPGVLDGMQAQPVGTDGSSVAYTVQRECRLLAATNIRNLSSATVLSSTPGAPGVLVASRKGLGSSPLRENLVSNQILG